MRSPRHIARRSVSSAISAFVSATALLWVGCGSEDHRSSVSPSLLRGTRGAPVLSADLAPATRLAHRFASAYARSAYRRRPPRLPGATAALSARLAQAAAKVPPSRRRLRPRALVIDLIPRSATIMHGRVEISDRRSPLFSVGFTLRKGAAGWRVVSASPPG